MEVAVQSRTLQRIIKSIATSGGASVKLRRSLGRWQGTEFDVLLGEASHVIIFFAITYGLSQLLCNRNSACR